MIQLIDVSFEGVKRLFAYDADDNDDASTTSNRKYFLIRANTENYNGVINGRNFYHQPITDQIRTMMRLEKLQ